MTRDFDNMHPSTSIGRLPKAFIAAAFANFLVGAALGGWLATQPTVWSVVGPVHGEINPFGWLTMLIYGMTYAVLATSANLHPPKPFIGWLHWIAAECAVVVVTVAFLLSSQPLLDVGLLLQFLAPVLFLMNILTAVFAARRHRHGRDTSTVATALNVASPPALAFLRRAPKYQSVDRVAQRGTDISLLLLIVGVGWTCLHALIQPSHGLANIPTAALVLVYYGWIGGTILAVALHLFPRFAGEALMSRTTATVGQFAWGLGVILTTIGSATIPWVSAIGCRLLGIAFVWFAVVYIKALCKRPSPDGPITFTLPSIVAWIASWTFCLILGWCLIFGLDPLSLAALHLLFLAFATNLVFGVGYTLFPLFIGRRPWSRSYAMGQIIASILGPLLMVIAFADRLSPHPRGFTTLLGIGGTIAALSAIAFLLQWRKAPM